MAKFEPGRGWSPEHAAAIIGCTADHVRALCRAGQIVAVLDRRRWWIDPDSARRYLARRQAGLQLQLRERDEVGT